MIKRILLQKPLFNAYKFCSEKERYFAKLSSQAELLSEQSQFHRNPLKYSQTLSYFKNLNRIEQYHTVIEEYETFLNKKSLFGQVLNGLSAKPKQQLIKDPELKKVVEQVKLAEKNIVLQKAIKNNLDILSTQIQSDQQQSALRFYIKNFFISLLIFYIYYEFDSVKEWVMSIYHTFFPSTKYHSDKNPSKPSKGLFGMFGSDDQPESDIKTRFSDVLGIDEFKEELQELVDYLKNPEKYTKSGAKLPKGLLLVGPPGTGKTLMAKALAGESNCSFFYKSGAEFDEMFVGMGARRIRNLFKAAREHSPSIIFIDEIDSVAGKRNAKDPTYSRDTINQILTEMDGFKETDSVIVIGATNFEQSLDPAIKRAGRFDKIIQVPLPDVKGRTQLFQYYLSKIKVEPTVDGAFFAKATSGFSGADIQNMVNMSILNAVKNKRKLANVQDFEFALDRISMGIGRTNLLVSDKEKLVTAYHEGGHTLIGLLTEGAMKLHKVTILPRGGALGFTGFFPNDDEVKHMTKTNIMAHIDVCMGGRAAEEIMFGKDDLTSGCSSDLINATNMAYRYVQQLGMSKELNMITLGDNQRLISDKYKFMLDTEVQSILKESYTRVKQKLIENQDKLKQLAEELIIQETLNQEQIKKLLNLN